MIDFYSKLRYDFSDLLALVKILRAPDGCPWDRVQTHESIRRNFIEEVYEACDAIDRNDLDNLREELGDVLLHVVFHADIESDAGHFDINDVCDAVVRKMISRHPALFGGGEALDWDEIKRREKGRQTLPDEMDSVARSLPALWRAEKILKKAEKAGVSAEAMLNGDNSGNPVGFQLLSAVYTAQQCGIDPEAALHLACDICIDRLRGTAADK